MMFARELYGRLISWNGGRVLFKEMLVSIMHSPMSFFDTTPLGRIINRFGKDVYTVDEQLPQTLRWYFSSLIKVLSVVVYICIVTPLFTIGLIPIVIVYRMTQNYFIKSQREITRLDSTSRSPIYALFTETLEGLTTIRAYQVEKVRRKKCCSLLDKNQQAFFLKASANCWLAVRLEFAGACIVTMCALFAVLGATEPDTGAGDGAKSTEAYAGMAGLGLSLALSITQSLNWSVRMASDLESQMISCERIKAYSVGEQEADHYANGDDVLTNFLWPRSGAIEFSDVTMRYRPGLPLVLRGVKLSIKGGEKVGVVETFPCITTRAQRASGGVKLLFHILHMDLLVLSV